MTQTDFKMDVPSKVILCLLEVDLKAIRGRQFMVHQVFLVSMEVSPDAAKYFEWYPYLYGPYSTILANRVNRLMDAEYIKAEKIKNVWEYSITTQGRDFLNLHLLDETMVYDMWEVQHLDGYSEQLGEMKDFAMYMGSKKFNEWLRAKYPEYFSRARD